MRTEGRLKTWNEARAFGFVVPDRSATDAGMPGPPSARGGLQDVFVHVSALPPSGRRPVVGERLSFEVETGPDGRPRACAVTYLDPAPPGTGSPDTRRAHRPQNAAGQGSGRHDTRAARPYRGPRAPAGGLFGWPLALLLAASGGVWVLGKIGGPGSAAPAAPASSALTATTPAAAAPAAAYRCDGRRHCSQMSSCAEASWVLRNCPDTKMDGDRDGIPCEDGLCGH